MILNVINDYFHSFWNTKHTYVYTWKNPSNKEKRKLYFPPYFMLYTQQCEKMKRKIFQYSVSMKNSQFISRE